MQRPQDRRTAKRVDMRARVRLRHGAFQLTSVEINNVSFTGFKAESELNLRPGEFISIELPSMGLVRATVAWCEDGVIGGKFLRATDVRQCFPSLKAVAAESLG